MLTDPTSHAPMQSEANAAIFYNMIAELKKTADRVEPTAFHEWLKELDDDGKLFRVYTQCVSDSRLRPLPDVR